MSDWRNWSHGLIVPLFSAFVLWRKRELLGTLAVDPSWFGALIIGGALGALVLGSLGAEYFLSRSSFLILLAGFVIYFLGWDHFRTVGFAWAFLFFMIPYSCDCLQPHHFSLMLAVM